MSTLLREIAPRVTLHRDPVTGIAWCEDRTTGIAHSAHPNIDASGSVEGMIAKGYWRTDARPVRARGFLYDVSASVVTTELDAIADAACQCGGVHRRDPVSG